ncbi:MAG: hypothetical protein HKO91_03570 [Desulfobacterales bacterium]|nr:hypothetical protein [Desulfobacterales bacterium]
MVDNSILATNLPTPGASGKVAGPRANTVATESTGGQSDIRIHLSE